MIEKVQIKIKGLLFRNEKFGFSLFFHIICKLFLLILFSEKYFMQTTKKQVNSYLIEVTVKESGVEFEKSKKQVLDDIRNE